MSPSNDLNIVTMTLAEVKTLLDESFRLITDAQLQMKELKNSFHAIATLLATSVKKLQDKLEETASTSTPSDQTFEMDSSSLLDIEQSLLYKDTIALKALFEIFEDLPWRLDYAYVFYISPAIRAVNQLAQYTNDPEQNETTLQIWWNQAQLYEPGALGMAVNIRSYQSMTRQLATGTIAARYRMTKPEGKEAMYFQTSTILACLLAKLLCVSFLSRYHFECQILTYI
ncbi:hypothetical protein FVEN_g6455 [Fusarium venenatum]|nr:hypothetical protein FVEN_g6455 [Fusarium venenatum]